MSAPKHKPNEYAHYKVRRQLHKSPPPGGVGSWIAWHTWDVKLPAAHELIQGDDWERHYSKSFDTFPEAIRYASRSAITDRIRFAITENIDEVVDLLVGALLTTIGDAL